MLRGMQALLDAIATAPWPAEAGRVFHGRGGLHPGCEHWVLDAWPPVWLLTGFRPATADELAAVQAALDLRCRQQVPAQPLNWVFQCRHEGRTHTQLMAGAVPEPHIVTEAGLRYAVHLTRGQNHGLFLDMAAGRRWVRAHIGTARSAGTPGLRVLNLFAYTCAFSVVALAAGAREVVNLDMSRGALAVGQLNHRLNGVADGARFLGHDLFSSWGKLRRSAPYDLVIVDPPSWQPGSFVAGKDYPRLLRRLPGLLAPGGHALLCLNAPELGPDFLHDALRAEAPALELLQRLPNPPAFADAEPDRALKVLVCRRSVSAEPAPT